MTKAHQQIKVRPHREDAGPGILVMEFRRLGMSERLDAPFRVKAHRHNEYELIIGDTGPYGCTVNGTGMHLRPGEGVLIKPGDVHEDMADEPVQYFAMSFSLTASGLGTDQVMIFPGESNPLTQRFSLGLQTHRDLLLHYQAAQNESGHFLGQLQDSLLSLFIWRVIRTFDPAVLNPAFYELSQTQTFPNRLHRILRKHIHTQVSVSEIAAEMNMSASTLAHTCRKLLGISPYKAFVKTKMERARHYIENSDWIIKEIANDLGFTDQYTFSRTFKTHFGISPAAWRKAHSSGVPRYRSEPVEE